MDKPYFYQPDVLAALPEIPPDTIISQTVLENERVKLILFGFAPGQELSEHTASMPAILQFVQGEAGLTLDADEVTAQPGTVVYMPPRLPHSVRAQTEVVMILLLLKGDLA
jgi:quercetin dioxygenase-like cupin family protein